MKLLDVITSPWAITPEKLAEIKDIYQSHLKREKIDFRAIEAETGVKFAGTDQEMVVIDGVAIIPIQGVLGKKMNLFSRISGGASTEIIGKQIDEAIKDEDVKAILLDIDSPGGTVDGTAELANKIFSARGEKPIVAFASGMMASAAVWIGSAADRVFISGETTITGSVGVIATHVDISKAEEKAGIKTTEVVSGHFKAITSEHKPLSKDGKAAMQEMVDALFSAFVSDLAKFKGKSAEEINKSVGDARTFIGRQGIEAGLVDGVSTFEAIIEQLSGGGGDSLPLEKHQPKGTKAMDKIENTPTAITAEFLAANHPEVYKSIQDKAAEASRKETYAEAYAKGAEDERNRIKDIEAHALPGHEDLIASLKFDGKTSGPEAAVQILRAEQALAKNKQKDIEEDAPEVIDEIDDIKPSAKGDPNNAPELSIKDRAKAEFESKKEIRDEFRTLDAYEGWLTFEESRKK